MYQIINWNESIGGTGGLSHAIVVWQLCANHKPGGICNYTNCTRIKTVQKNGKNSSKEWIWETRTKVQSLVWDASIRFCLEEPNIKTGKKQSAGVYR
ncbi:MAG TPA: hypothetical protein VK152_04080 [Paludibacter sp.]|nr:hypothetical protein [Paludibacter sp.]